MIEVNIIRKEDMAVIETRVFSDWSKARAEIISLTKDTDSQDDVLASWKFTAPARKSIKERIEPAVSRMRNRFLKLNQGVNNA